MNVEYSVDKEKSLKILKEISDGRQLKHKLSYVDFDLQYSDLDSTEFNTYTDPIERLFKVAEEDIDYREMVIYNCEYNEKEDTINMSHWVPAFECDTSYATYYYNEKFKCWLTLWDEDQMGVLNFNEYFK